MILEAAAKRLDLAADDHTFGRGELRPFHVFKAAGFIIRSMKGKR
jgi:hypothetical protein